MLEDLIVPTIVDRTTNCEHGIAGHFDPPRTGALHACVADELVGRFDAAVSDRKFSQANRAIAEALSMFFQIAFELPDKILGLERFGLHSAQPCNGVAHISVEQTAERCLNPFKDYSYSSLSREGVSAQVREGSSEMDAMAIRGKGALWPGHLEHHGYVQPQPSSGV
jgi:hypothetical protein